MSTTVLLTGPAGSGKSTAASRWAARGRAPRAAIDTDSLRALIHAGAALPEHGWTDETERQWNIAMDLWPAMARVYKRHDIDCIIDVYAPPPPDDPWKDLIAELGIRRVILLPSLNVCLDRNRRRDRVPILADEQVRTNYEDFESCVRQTKPEHVIDNSELTVEETVDAIEAELGEPS